MQSTRSYYLYVFCQILRFNRLSACLEATWFRLHSLWIRSCRVFCATYFQQRKSKVRPCWVLHTGAITQTHMISTACGAASRHRDISVSSSSFSLSSSSAKKTTDTHCHVPTCDDRNRFDPFIRKSCTDASEIKRLAIRVAH